MCCRVKGEAQLCVLPGKGLHLKRFLMKMHPVQQCAFGRVDCRVLSGLQAKRSSTCARISVANSALVLHLLRSNSRLPPATRVPNGLPASTCDKAGVDLQDRSESGL